MIERILAGGIVILRFGFILFVGFGGSPVAAIEAHRLCFIANSVNFPVSIEPAVIVSG